MNWKIRGEVILSCNCDLFCPCVISLGRARPSQGYCHSWWGIKIREGECQGEKLDGFNVGILLDVPGRMGEGDWTVALYIDERAGDAAFNYLNEIFTGRGGGSLGILSLLIGNVLGAQKAAIDFAETESGWRMIIPKVADCAINRIPGRRPDESVVIRNSQYWVAPDITVAVGGKSRVRAFGRVWNFDGMSAEHAAVDWSSDG